MKLSFLVIDDCADFLRLAEHLLRRAFEGATVTSLEPNAVGLSDTGFGLGGHDVVLLDYDLGGAGDGIEWLRNVVGVGPFPPTVVITASADGLNLSVSDLDISSPARWTTSPSPT